MTLSVVLFLTALVCCKAYIIVSRESTKDVNIVEGLDHRNEGTLASAYLGFDNHVDFGVSRILMDFDLSGLSSENLLKACLIINFSDSRENYTPCKADSDGPGCGSAHIVTRPWNEGKQMYSTVEEGDSSWLFSSYPTEWSTPGGDFDSNAIGWMVPEPEGSQQVHFYLDTSRFKMYLDDPSSFHGFLLRDDSNPGHIELDMRECAILEDCSRCIGRIAPRLELEYPDPTPPPTNQPTTRAPVSSMPTKVPTPSPVQATRSPIASTNKPNPSPTSRPTPTPTNRPSQAPMNDPTVLPNTGTDGPTPMIQVSTDPTSSPVESVAVNPELPTPESPSGYVIVARNTTQDAGIASAAEFRCGGGQPQLFLGFDPDPSYNTSRVLLDFDLTSLSSESLTKACIILTISGTSGDYIPCSNTSSSGPGCGTAHVITTDWNEGDSTGGPVQEGESTWLHNSYPSEWSIPGGDFGEAVGQMIAEPDGSMEIHFVLQPDKMRAVLDDPSQFNGFLLQDDDNTGAVILESRECLLDMSTPECPTTVVPRLELEYFYPVETITPSPSVVAAPLSTAIPTLQPSTRVGEACGRFSQNMTLDEVISRDLIERSIESLLEFRSFRYIANTEELTTDVALNELTQQRNETNLRVLTLIEYTICYEQPLSVAPLEKIQSYPRELVFFLQLETERLDLERDLRSWGIPIQEGGLTSAVLLVGDGEAREVSNAAGNNLTVIIAVAVGACAVVVAVVLFVFRKKNKNKDGSYSPGTSVVPVPVQTTVIPTVTDTVNGLPVASVQLAKNEPVASVAFANSEALDFKMQAQSVPVEPHENDENVA